MQFLHPPIASWASVHFSKTSSITVPSQLQKTIFHNYWYIKEQAKV